MVAREQLGPGMGDQAGVAINNENPASDFFHPEYAQYAHLSRISQSIPPFYADGYAASESVPESTGSVSTSHDSESEVVGPVQKQRGNCTFFLKFFLEMKFS